MVMARGHRNIRDGSVINLPYYFCISIYNIPNIQSDSYRFLQSVKNKLMYELEETRLVINLHLLICNDETHFDTMYLILQ